MDFEELLLVDSLHVSIVKSFTGLLHNEINVKYVAFVLVIYNLHYNNMLSFENILVYVDNKAVYCKKHH